MNLADYKNYAFLMSFLLVGSLYAISFKKKSYQKLGSSGFKQLQKNNKDLKRSFNQTRMEIKKRRHTVGDMRGFIKLCKEGTQDHSEQVKKLRKQKSTGSLNLKKRCKMRKRKKEAREIEKKAAKMLALQKECGDGLF